MTAVAPPVERQHRFTVEDYHVMGRAGVFKEDDRVELIDGQIIAMTPIGQRHVACVNQLTYLFTSRVYDRGASPNVLVSVQNPVRLDAHHEPQPDVVLLRPRKDFYADGHPGPEDVLLVVEVADTSLDFDRDVKVPRYAAAGIAEVWLVALEADYVEVYRGPEPDGYAEIVRHRRGEALTVAALPAMDALAVDDALGEPVT